MFAGHTHSNETKQQMSANRLGVKNANYGNRWHQTEEQRRLHSKLSSGENNGMFGKTHTDESKEKNRQSQLGRVWVNNGKIAKHVKHSELDYYLSNGFITGRKLK